jgi:hypothetical protein
MLVMPPVWEQGGNVMTTSAGTVRAVFDGGPHAGQELVIGVDADGGPPEQVAITDPLAVESSDPDAPPAAVTTYRLRGPGEEEGTYIYRPGQSG